MHTGDTIAKLLLRDRPHSYNLVPNHILLTTCTKSHRFWYRYHAANMSARMSFRRLRRLHGNTAWSHQTSIYEVLCSHKASSRNHWRLQLCGFLVTRTTSLSSFSLGSTAGSLQIVEHPLNHDRPCTLLETWNHYLLHKKPPWSWEIFTSTSWAFFFFTFIPYTASAL